MELASVKALLKWSMKTSKIYGGIRIDLYFRTFRREATLQLWQPPKKEPYGKAEFKNPLKGKRFSNDPAGLDQYVSQ